MCSSDQGWVSGNLHLKIVAPGYTGAVGPFFGPTYGSYLTNQPCLFVNLYVRSVCVTQSFFCAVDATPVSSFTKVTKLDFLINSVWIHGTTNFDYWAKICQFCTPFLTIHSTTSLWVQVGLNLVFVAVRSQLQLLSRPRCYKVLPSLPMPPIFIATHGQ